VACQLLRYFFEFEDIISTYGRRIPPQIISEINNPQKSAFLIVPIQHSQKAVTAMNTLQSNNYIKSYFTDETSEIYILKVVFPVF
jgi:hypothetical protein